VSSGIINVKKPDSLGGISIFILIALTGFFDTLLKYGVAYMCEVEND
jgi:hypothetical protein